MPSSTRAFGGRLPKLGSVFLLAYLALFAGMSRRPGFYDEGIMLTGAMRVAAGQVPHRDFYFIYGPAEVYLLAGLFKVFGQSLLVERLLDLGIKALLVTAVYGIGRSYCSRSIAVFISTLTILWLFGLSVFGYATTPISLLNLVGCFLILPVFAGRLSSRRMATAGAVSGLAALFRYDTGLALAGIHACVLGIAIYLRFTGTSKRLRMFASEFWPYLLGFLLLTVPPAIYYASVAPVSALMHDVVIFPAKYYHSARSLPFPRIDSRSVENLGVYLPIAVACLALYALFKPRLRAWRGFLITFTLLLAVMYLKGLVRVSPLQMYLATLPSLLLMAVLFQHRSEFARLARIAISSLMGLSLLPAGWSALHEIRQDQLWHYSMAQRVFRYRPGGIETVWCRTQNAVTRGFCFLPEDDRIHAIEFIDSHTQPGQTLYCGLSHHDRIFANDNVIYFATQRMPATRWSHFDPDLQNSYGIQTQMVQELERNAPPYVVLDSEFELSREPNDSSKSSGVTLLDRYIHDAYQAGPVFGTMSVWKRR